MFLSPRYSSRLSLKGFQPKNSRYLQSSLVKRLCKRLGKGGGIRGGRNGWNVVERFGNGFDKDSQRIWGGRKDDRLPASIEAAIEVVCQPVDSFLSLLRSFTPLHDWLLSVELSTLQDLLGQQKAYHHLLTSPPDYFFLLHTLLLKFFFLSSTLFIRFCDYKRKIVIKERVHD